MDRKTCREIDSFADKTTSKHSNWKINTFKDYWLNTIFKIQFKVFDYAKLPDSLVTKLIVVK